MTFLSVDPATHTGWGIHHWLTGVQSGVQDFTGPKHEPVGLKLHRFRLWFESQLQATDISVVIFEEPHHRGQSTNILLGMTAHIKELCASHDIPHVPIRSMTLKKFATGKGHADKDEMVAAAIERFPHFREKMILYAAAHRLQQKNLTEPRTLAALTEYYSDEADALFLLAHGVVSYCLPDQQPEWCAGLAITPPKTMKKRKKKGTP